MIRKFVLPLLSVAGILLAIYTVRGSQKELPAAQPASLPPQAGFTTQIAGAGLIEASTENISVATGVPGMVTEVFVQVGATVKKGDKLFSVDSRDLRAELCTREAALALAQQKLSKLEAGVRPEDVPPAEAKLLEATAQLADKQDQFDMWKGRENTGAVSSDEVNRRRFAVQIAEANVAEAKAQLALVKAGPWKPDIDIARSELQSAQAQLDALKIDLERRTVVAPVDGQILQVKVRVGEYAQVGFNQQALMVIGNVTDLHVRVDIDENDAWRLKPGTAAVGSLRGNSSKRANLTFVRVEPYVIPKRSLTGDSTERVDTRVLQVVYKIGQHDFPIYVGQQMDVSIDAGN